MYKKLGGCNAQPTILIRMLQFFTQYKGEESMNSVVLTPGLDYLAQLTYQTVRERSDDQIIAGTCVSGELYSQAECMVSV